MKLKELLKSIKDAEDKIKPPVMPAKIKAYFTSVRDYIECDSGKEMDSVKDEVKKALLALGKATTAPALKDEMKSVADYVKLLTDNLIILSDKGRAEAEAEGDDKMAEVIKKLPMYPKYISSELNVPEDPNVDAKEKAVLGNVLNQIRVDGGNLEGLYKELVARGKWAKDKQTEEGKVKEYIDGRRKLQALIDQFPKLVQAAIKTPAK